MDFDTYASRARNLYLEWLTSGRQDEGALHHSLKVTYQAVESLPAGRLTPAQERQWNNLADIYQRVQGQTWHPEHRQGWLEEAQALLRELRP